MVENKATKRALKDTGYTLKLILGSDPERGSQIIDISEPVGEALSVEDVFPNDMGDYGIAKRILGLWESCSSPNWLSTPPMYTYTSDLSILQDIARIIDASIVNAKQASAIKTLIADAFQRREDDRLKGLDNVFQEHWGKVTILNK